MELKLGDIVRLRKRHPCGSQDWQVVRLGADIAIKCLGCSHRVLMERRDFERRVRTIVHQRVGNNKDGIELSEKEAT